ncbi:MAG TPA: TPM domain-containing protein [Candidatus Acidoferrales bacterium]|nr:TPM domain-containing protein [Candidatus Acidoferrales bacterium]
MVTLHCRALRFGAVALLAGFALSYGIALAADFQAPARPTTEVVDVDGVMSVDARTALESELESFEAKTGHHVVVYVAQTTGGMPLETWTAKTASAWKVGQKGKDDGAILFVFMRDHTVRIEVGYGLEGTLTDANSKQIIDTVIVPRMKSGATDTAISEGAAAMLVTIDPTFNPTTKPDQAADAASTSDDDIGFWGYVIGWGVLLIALYIAFAFVMHIVASIRRGFLIRREGQAAADKDMKRSWLNFFLFSGLASSSSSSTGGGFFSGGFGGGGGGFSGGSFGGGFGGGGASGSW